MTETKTPHAALVLTEHRDSDPVRLFPTERDALRELIPQMTVVAVPGHEDLYVLNPRNAVGAMQLGERRIEVRPKIGIKRMAFVLAYSMNPKHWRDSGFDFTEESDLFEAVVPGFAYQVEEALRGGPLMGY